LSKTWLQNINSGSKSGIKWFNPEYIEQRNKFIIKFQNDPNLSEKERRKKYIKFKSNQRSLEWLINKNLYTYRNVDWVYMYIIKFDKSENNNECIKLGLAVDPIRRDFNYIFEGWKPYPIMIIRYPKIVACYLEAIFHYYMDNDLHDWSYKGYNGWTEIYKSNDKVFSNIINFIASFKINNHNLLAILSEFNEIYSMESEDFRGDIVYSAYRLESLDNLLYLHLLVTLTIESIDNLPRKFLSLKPFEGYEKEPVVKIPYDLQPQVLQPFIDDVIDRKFCADPTNLYNTILQIFRDKELREYAKNCKTKNELADFVVAINNGI
jgi:hypothetical protein